MNIMPQTRRERALLSATGQVTSYGSGTGVDDGALKKGIVKAYTALTAGQYSGTTNIVLNGKTDVHSNACVEDHNTGLIWSRDAAASVGPASDGKLPWTTTGSGATAEGIFPYVAAANAAALAGYSDWRIPNVRECEDLMDYDITTTMPPIALFPNLPVTDRYWSSTTRPGATSWAVAALGPDYGSLYTKTTTKPFMLVRGGR